jgi:hypothetical protein
MFKNWLKSFVKRQQIRSSDQNHGHGRFLVTGLISPYYTDGMDQRRGLHGIAVIDGSHPVHVLASSESENAK